MKTYVLMISKTFMKGHPRAGQPTEFKRKLLTGALTGDAKLHTIRSGYDHWSKVCKEVNAKRAVLSLREWSGKPYRSKQREIVKVRRLGVERVRITHRQIPHMGKWHFCIGIEVEGKNLSVKPEVLAKNDGLEWLDFFNWFKKDFDGVIIHFSRLRYDA